jgi:hypothetical protein
MHRFFDPAGSADGSRKRRRRCCLPPCRTASAPQARRFRGSIARPARTPTDASPPPSRTTTHGSGPSWLATPSMLDSLIPFSGPVYPGAPYTEPRTLLGHQSERLRAADHGLGRCAAMAVSLPVGDGRNSGLAADRPSHSGRGWAMAGNERLAPVSGWRQVAGSPRPRPGCGSAPRTRSDCSSPARFTNTGQRSYRHTRPQNLTIKRNVLASRMGVPYVRL